MATARLAPVPGALGPVVGAFPSAWPRLDLALPWHLLPDLAIGAVVIAVVGFAEPTAIARRFGRTGDRWDPSRELIGQGLANLATGVTGGMPVGASFSRSALHHRLGAMTRAGAVVTGLTVLALTPAAGLLADLPRAVLAAVVLSAITDLVRIGPVADLWRFGRMQTTTAWATAALVLVFEPRVDVAVLVGRASSSMSSTSRARAACSWTPRSTTARGGSASTGTCGSPTPRTSRTRCTPPGTGTAGWSAG